MYFAIICVLSLLLAFRDPPLRLVSGTWVTLACVALATALPAVGAWLVGRRALHLFDSRPEEPEIAQLALARGMGLVQLLVLSLHAALLLLTDWLVVARDLPWVKTQILLPSLVAVLPFCVSLILTWLALWPVDRAIRQLAVEVALLRKRPAHPVWTVWQYLAYQLRHQLLFVLLPMLVVLVARDLILQNDRRLLALHPFLPDVLLGAAAILTALLTPVMPRFIWHTAPLPPGPLRDRLERLGKLLRVRFRDILIWRSGGAVINAVVVGALAPLRYVLLTDAMLEQLDDRRIEAVFGHEAGHVRRRHILIILMLALCTGCILAIVSARMRGVHGDFAQMVALGVGAALLAKWWFAFGWVSHQFERQADVFGAYALTLAGLPCGGPCLLHSGLPSAAQQDDGKAAGAPPPLCSSAAHLFSLTLNEVAVLNGIAPDAGSWRHPSIASRSRFVIRMALDPAALKRFEGRMGWLLLGITAMTALLALWAATELKIWSLGAALYKLLSPADG